MGPSGPSTIAAGQRARTHEKGALNTVRESIEYRCVSLYVLRFLSLYIMYVL